MSANFPVPQPPVAEGVGLPLDVSVGDVVAAIAAARARYGDTFAVRSGDGHYLFTFSQRVSKRSTGCPRRSSPARAFYPRRCSAETMSPPISRRSTAP